MTNTLRNTQIITAIRPAITFEYERPTRAKKSKNWLRYILGPVGASLINRDSAGNGCCSTATQQSVLLQLGTGRLF